MTTRLRNLWCGWTHGGGQIKRDETGSINWQCNRCGRWSVPVPTQDEAAHLARELKARYDRQR